MNPSAHSFVHTATDACSYPSAYTDTCYSASHPSHPYPDDGSSLYEDPSSWTEGWSGESVPQGPCPEADRALFEAFLTAEAASISSPGPCPAVPIQSTPFYYAASNFLPHPTDATHLYAGHLDSSQSYLYPISSIQSAMPPAFAQVLPETTTPCISPDYIYPSAFCHGQSGLADDYSTDASSRSSPASRRAVHRSPSVSPYPTPSPEPSPRTNTIIIASQRRNAPAGAPLPPSNAWQCPHCPYIQRNRRSPDLKRHIKTHTRGDEVADWVCCGVPVRNAAELGVPATVVREGPVFEFDGVRMVGGCRRAFSRRDALHRHLQRESGRCFGDAQSLHQRGNRESC